MLFDTFLHIFLQKLQVADIVDYIDNYRVVVYSFYLQESCTLSIWRLNIVSEVVMSATYI